MSIQDDIDAIDPTKPINPPLVKTDPKPTSKSVRDNFLAVKNGMQGLLDALGLVSAPSVSSMMLTGISFTSSALIVATDNALVALGRLQAQISLRATIDSPTFTGIPQAPTAASGTNNTQLSTTAFVHQAIADIIASSPAALDTLNELAAALGNDPNFATTITNALALKAPLASPSLTGTPTAPTASVGTNSTQIASTAFVLTMLATLGTAASKNVGAASTDVAAGDRGMPTGGTGGQVLSKVDGTNYNVTWTTPSGGGGGLTNWTEALNTSSPNATVNVISFSASSGSANVDIVLVPKGTGGFSLSIPDGTATGGNKRGSRSIDLQIYRTANSQVCSSADGGILGGKGNSNGGGTACVIVSGEGNTIYVGTYDSFIGGGSQNSMFAAQGAIVGGALNSASGQYAFIGAGRSNSANGADAFIGGGEYNTVSASLGCIVGGVGAKTNIIGQQAFSGGAYLISVGDSQSSLLVLKALTTNATATALTTDFSGAGPANQIILQNQQAVTFTGTVTAKQKNSTNCASWKVEGHVVRGANAASTVLRYQLVTNLFNSSTWSISIVVDTTNGGAKITFTGAAATNIAIVANIYTSEAIYV